MAEDKEFEKDRQRAEVFDALGHPTRIAILKALSREALGFAELKKKTFIESSGHLQHHLNKLDGLIKTDEYGKYCLSDQGKDALLTVQTVENVSSTKPEKNSGNNRSRHFNTAVVVKSASIVLVALLIASSAIAVLEYTQVSTLQNKITRLDNVNFDALAYYNQFGVIPSTNVNASFSPPISMYRALQIALQNEGWNKTALNGMSVDASLMNCRTITDSAVYNGSDPATYNGSRNSIQVNASSFTNGTYLNGTFVIGPVTNPPSDYSDLYGNGVVYRYVWEITVAPSTGRYLPPPGFALVDAATGQLLPNPPLY